jgi:dienelactone hydrolase
MSMGYTLPRLHIADLHRLHDFVCTLPNVKAGRIGLGGLSGGGTLSYLTGAFDERFKAVCVMCGMCRYNDYAVGINGCGMQVVPRLYPTGDVGEVLSLIAPRPLLLGQGRLDSTFDVIQFKSIAEDARRAYVAAGAEDRFQASVFDLAHQFNVDLAAEFYMKWL